MNCSYNNKNSNDLSKKNYTSSIRICLITFLLFGLLQSFLILIAYQLFSLDNSRSRNLLINRPSINEKINEFITFSVSLGLLQMSPSFFGYQLLAFDRLLFSFSKKRVSELSVKKYKLSDRFNIKVNPSMPHTHPPDISYSLFIQLMRSKLLFHLAIFLQYSSYTFAMQSYILLDEYSFLDLNSSNALLNRVLGLKLIVFSAILLQNWMMENFYRDYLYSSYTFTRESRIYDIPLRIVTQVQYSSSNFTMYFVIFLQCWNTENFHIYYSNVNFSKIKQCTTEYIRSMIITQVHYG